MIDLSLVATDDLLKELERRLDFMIFAGMKELGEGLQTNEHSSRWKGHVTFCAGMATDLIREMQDWAIEDEDEDDDDPAPEVLE